MVHAVTMKVLMVGDFQDGSLKVDGKPWKYRNIAIVQCRSDDDCRNLAHLMSNFGTVTFTTKESTP